MRYLKRYSAMHSLLEQSNESVDLKSEILDICHAKLAYLLDDSRFKVEVLELSTHYKVTLVCENDGDLKRYLGPNKYFDFSEIREDYISFVEYLDLKIGIDHNFFRQPGLVVEFGTFHTSTPVTMEQLEDIDIKSFGVSVYIKRDKV